MPLVQRNYLDEDDDADIECAFTGQPQAEDGVDLASEEKKSKKKGGSAGGGFFSKITNAFMNLKRNKNENIVLKSA